MRSTWQGWLDCTSKKYTVGVFADDHPKMGPSALLRAALNLHADKTRFVFDIFICHTLKAVSKNYKAHVHPARKTGYCALLNLRQANGMGIFSQVPGNRLKISKALSQNNNTEDRARFHFATSLCERDVDLYDYTQLS